MEDARALAARLGIGHITYDARKVFQEQIIDYFIDEYMSGHTPVPCTLCNNQLKWPLLAKSPMKWAFLFGYGTLREKTVGRWELLYCTC